MPTNVSWVDLAKRYEVDVPAMVRELYEKSDGESELRGGSQIGRALRPLRTVV